MGKLTASCYENDNVEEGLIELGLIIGEDNIEDNIKVLKREFKKRHNLFSWHLEMAEYMVEGSRQYYLAAFEPFSSNELFQKFIADIPSAERPAIGRKLRSDIFAFLGHWMLIPLNDSKEEIKRRIQNRNISLSTKMIKRTLFTTWDSISLLVNGASLIELFRMAKNGDDDSLCKLVKVDKTAFAHEWVTCRINKAAYNGDWKFFEMLGKAVAEDPLKHKGRKVALDKIFLVLKFYWDKGLYRLTDNELYDLLIASNIVDYDNVESLSKYLRRHRQYLPK